MIRIISNHIGISWIKAFSMLDHSQCPQYGSVSAPQAGDITRWTSASNRGKNSPANKYKSQSINISSANNSSLFSSVDVKEHSGLNCSDLFILKCWCFFFFEYTSHYRSLSSQWWKMEPPETPFCACKLNCCLTVTWLRALSQLLYDICAQNLTF